MLGKKLLQCNVNFRSMKYSILYKANTKLHCNCFSKRVADLHTKIHINDTLHQKKKNKPTLYFATK